MSAYAGVRLWDGGAVYFNPELLQGFGLSDTVGLGGFSNGEAQKSHFPTPRYSTSRLFLRHTFGFGGEQETLESAPNQLSEKVDVSRLTVQAGRFAVADVFDGNSYAKDTRKDFMNWAMWAPGAFDYSADKIGLTWGATAEFNQKNWALRAGYFLMDEESNSSNFDMNLFRRGEYVMELEERYNLFGRPGKLRIIPWINSVFAGSYRETLDNPALDLDIAQTRKSRIKYGYAVTVEQEVADGVGVFGRWSWNDGHNEIMAFADIDRSLSGGVSIKGKSWGRPERHDRHRRRDQRPVARPPRLHRGRRPRPADRRRRAQLPDRAHPRNLLLLCAARHDLADLRLSVHRQPGLQRRPRPGVTSSRPGCTRNFEAVYGPSDRGANTTGPGRRSARAGCSQGRSTRRWPRRDPRLRVQPRQLAPRSCRNRVCSAKIRQAWPRRRRRPTDRVLCRNRVCSAKIRRSLAAAMTAAHGSRRRAWARARLAMHRMP